MDTHGYHEQAIQRLAQTANLINGIIKMIKKAEANSRRIARVIFKRHYCLPNLKRNCVVHHIDGNPFNNDIENLTLMTRSKHTKYHVDQYWANGGVGAGTTISEDIKDLELQLILYNSNLA